MRLLTFSIFRSCMLNRCVQHVLAQSCSGRPLHAPSELEESKHIVPEEGPLVVAVGEWPPEHSALREAALRDMTVIPRFVSDEEETAMLVELEPVLRRMRYEFDHWDNAIHGYRETERGEWQPVGEAVVCRVRAAAFGPARGAEPLSRQHVLDLAPSGYIKPHVDAVRFCGDVIAGLCLLSSAVMRFTHVKHDRLVFEALLPQRCLYIMKGVARYDFKHEVLGGAASAWRGRALRRGRRVAVLTRSVPRPETHTHTHTHAPPVCGRDAPDEPAGPPPDPPEPSSKPPPQDYPKDPPK